MFFENVKLALKSMKTSKMRTILSLLGIIIGVASVVTILNLGESAQRSMTDSLSSSGMDIITFSPMSYSRDSSIYTDEFCNDIVRDVDGVEFVNPENSTYIQTSALGNSANGNLMGVVSTYDEANGLELQDGSFFTLEDNISKRNVIVLGARMAETLFPGGNAVGSYVKVNRSQPIPFKVVGVLKPKNASMIARFDDCYFIPYNTFNARFRWGDQVGNYVVKVREGYDTNKVTSDLKAFLNDKAGKDSYYMFSPSELAQMSNEIMGTMKMFLAAIASISLLVGGIGIMNIMLVSVAERTKEIGIRKALGASPSVIRGQFIIESVTLTVIGGLIGSLLGIGISNVVSDLFGWTLHLSYFSIILAVGFSMFVGIFFGWYPARKAAGLDPIEALNYE